MANGNTIKDGRQMVAQDRAMQKISIPMGMVNSAMPTGHWKWS
jgi:hypothetical protein